MALWQTDAFHPHDKGHFTEGPGSTGDLNKAALEAATDQKQEDTRKMREGRPAVSDGCPAVLCSLPEKPRHIGHTGPAFWSLTEQSVHNRYTRAVGKNPSRNCLYTSYCMAG